MEKHFNLSKGGSFNQKAPLKKVENHIWHENIIHILNENKLTNESYIFK